MDKTSSLRKILNQSELAIALTILTGAVLIGFIGYKNSSKDSYDVGVFQDDFSERVQNNILVGYN